MNTKASFKEEKSSREEEHEKIAYYAALEGVVLLKNEDILPVNPGKVALFGAGAKRTIKGGSGSGEVNERHSISIMEGLINKGFEIATRDWIEDYEKDYEKARIHYKHRLKEHLKRRKIQQLLEQPFRYPQGRGIQKQELEMSETEFCIYVISRQSGEGSDRWLKAGDFHLTERERENLIMCARYYEKILVVINVGGPFDLRFTDDIPEIKGLIYFAQQGCQGGRAFADLITGDKSFSGKLTDTWFKKYEDVPFYNEYSYMRGNPMNAFYEEGIYVGYRYCDSYNINPQYPFGFGMGYTDFQWEFLNAEVEKVKLCLRGKVKNRGKHFSGKEVIQFYISCPQNHISKEYQKLIAFHKTKELKPEEEEIFELTVDVRSFASYHENEAAYILDAGDYIVRMGNSSRNTQPCTVVNLDQKVYTSIHQNICKTRSAVREIKPAKITYQDELIDLPVLHLNHREIKTEAFNYENVKLSPGSIIENTMEALSDDEMIQLVIGSGMKKTVLNQNHFNVPGAAGYTTSKLVNKGIPNAVLADGPAGLRLAKRSTLQARGKIKMVDPPMDFFEYLPSFVKKRILGDPKKHTIIYQFTTAFPIATALAQSWNTQLVEQVGEAIGKEMCEYGVDFWLGPGMNIHRNPLGGRNFEYYSEDPYVTGKIAAAIIKGCQKTPRNKATVKHFCVNNQEGNRQKVSSNINERALREIYLRGFEIAIKESRPKAVMTSYNRINGLYTANSHDLCTKILRNEWGFEGVVMTDWYATGKDLADPVLCIKAGNDLIMPGKKSDKKRISRGLKKKEIEREDLVRSVQNILMKILENKHK